MSKSTIEFLHHILDELSFLEKEMTFVTEETFMHDEIRKRACARSLEIIGEAVKQIPDSFRKEYPDVDWKSYAGLRDKLIHHYFGVDYALVWDVITHEFPELKTKIATIIEQNQ